MSRHLHFTLIFSLKVQNFRQHHTFYVITLSIQVCSDHDVRAVPTGEERDGTERERGRHGPGPARQRHIWGGTRGREAAAAGPEGGRVHNER